MQVRPWDGGWMNKTTRFDVAEYLDTPERRAEYVSAALETGDAAFVHDAVSITERARHLAVRRVAQRRVPKDGQR
jgi:DNA-binding phage protein